MRPCNVQLTCYSGTLLHTRTVEIYMQDLIKNLPDIPYIGFRSFILAPFGALGFILVIVLMALAIDYLVKKFRKPKDNCGGNCHCS